MRYLQVTMVSTTGQSHTHVFTVGTVATIRDLVCTRVDGRLMQKL